MALGIELCHLHSFPHHLSSYEMVSKAHMLEGCGLTDLHRSNGSAVGRFDTLALVRPA